MREYNRQELNLALEPYKSGATNNYPALLAIQKRLPEMVKENYNETLALVVVALTKAFESMNLSRPMNGAQIVELADTILDSANEDFLALEDVVLFLQGLTRGKYGKLYESMDIPKFMDFFEVYREERHRALVKHREDEYIRTKEGHEERSVDQKDEHREALGEYLKEMYNGQVRQTD